MRFHKVYQRQLWWCRVFCTGGLILSTLLWTACSLSGGMKLFSDAPEPLTEITLSGSGKEKVAVISVSGEISGQARRGLIVSPKSSMLQEVVARLNLAQADSDVKALVLKVESPGGSITASDILYNELVNFKKQTGVPVVVSMMNVAASGGYYVSLPADYIMAHPTTVTGAVGVIFFRPQVQNLMEKVGVGVTVYKSGCYKDMGSPFRPIAEKEKEIFSTMIDLFAGRFLNQVQKHRNMTASDLEEIQTARIYSAQEAQEAGLIDAIGYLEDALSRARQLADLPENARVVVYRRTDYPNDNIYNSLEAFSPENGGQSLIHIDLLNTLPGCRTGFYYLWWPSVTE